MLNATFASVFAENVPQTPVLSERIQREEQTALDEDKVRVYFRQLKPCKLMWSDRLHPKVLSEMVDILERLLSVIFDRSWRSENWRKANIAIIFRKANMATLENYRPISFTLVPGKNQGASPSET